MSYLVEKQDIDIRNCLNDGKTLNIEFDPIEKRLILSIDGYEFFPRECHIIMLNHDNAQSTLRYRFLYISKQSNGMNSEEWIETFIHNPYIITQIFLPKE